MKRRHGFNHKINDIAVLLWPNCKARPAADQDEHQGIYGAFHRPMKGVAAYLVEVPPQSRKPLNYMEFVAE